MYDYAGEWLYRVGFPAKSGVAGGILAVLPGQFGVAVFSPRLDSHGNSVRGVAACQALSEDLELHFLRAPRAALATLRSRHTLRSIGSRRNRSEEQRLTLSRHGDAAVVYELQGDLSFCGVERLARQVASEADATRQFVIDLRRVTGIDATASRFVLAELEAARAAQRSLAFVGLQRFPRLLRMLEEARALEASLEFRQFEDPDVAIEWCETRLLAQHESTSQGAEIALGDHELTDGLDPGELGRLERALVHREFPARHMIVKPGQPADAVFLLVRGEVSVLVETSGSQMHRLATLSPGMVFGEPALHGKASLRSAFVRADTACTCLVLDREAIAALETAEPRILIRLLRNALHASARVLTRTAALRADM
jgi:glutaminase